jgi:hypothetical protein
VKKRKPPSYRLHKGSGQALVEVNGQRTYLGKYDSPKSHERYRAIVGQWLARPGEPISTPPSEADEGLTVAELMATYWRFVTGLEARGLLDEKLVVIMTDFGRTPQINGNAGRDHWTFCYSLLLAGAGIRGGTVYGSSDAQAAYPKDKPVSTGDICATIYHCLGIDPDMPVHDQLNRPHAVTHGGRPIADILV